MGKVAPRVLEAFINGSLKGCMGILFSRFPPEKMEWMIDNKYLPITSAYHHANNMPWEKEGLSQKDLEEVEKLRSGTFLTKKVLPLLETVRRYGRNIPPVVMQDKINPEWMKKEGFKKYPKLLDIIEQKGEAGEEYLEMVCMEINLYVTGRLIWDSKNQRMVMIE